MRLDEPAWRRRFTAPELGFPRWGRAAPHRLALASTEGGAWQAWAFDRATGERRRVSDEPVGVEEAFVTPDGEGVVWWHDATGDERGRWVVASFRGGDPRPLLPDAPEGWSMGLAMVPGAIVVGLALDDDYAVLASVDGTPPRLLYRHPQPAGVGQEWPQGTGGLSADGRLACVRHTEDGDILHHALRVMDVRTGETVREQRDPGRNLMPAAWSPVPGDQRLALLHERATFERPALWNPGTGEWQDLEIDLPGAAFPLDWWPDGSALLLRHEHRGLDRLYRLDLTSHELTPVAEPGGEITDAAVRPDGEVWLRASDSTRAPRIVAEDGREVIAPEGERAPEGRRYRSLWFENPAGEQIQAFVATPPGATPFPTVLSAHGGPEWHERDRFDPEVQALVDHGFAVALVNFRGSTGYGIAFRNALVGNVGFPESEDLLACLGALVAEGTADPERVALIGWSWGGYLALLNAGLNPDRWRAVFGGIPTGDYVEAHEASSPPLRAWDLAMFGGSPQEVPQLYRERDPMTYADRVTAPVLIIAGEHDSRCPPSSALKWADAVRAHGGDVEVHLYPTGHHANAVVDRVRHMELLLAFLRRHVALADPANRASANR